MQKSVAHEQKAVVVLQSWLRKTLSSDSKNVGIYKGNPMNKNILAIAIAAAVAAPSAFAAATVYGVAHMSVDAVQNAANGATNNGSVTNVASNSSRLGVKGSEDLGAGLKAVYQFETTLNLDGENAGTNPAAGFGTQRNSYAGLAGGFGTVMLGIHDTPFKLVGRKYDMFGDQIGDMRNLTATGTAANATGTSAGFDLRPSNVIAYASPTFGGVSGMLAISNDKRNSTDNAAASKKNAYSASIGYAAGKLNADIS
jgi:Outer membrane protein (porin)